MCNSKSIYFNNSLKLTASETAHPFRGANPGINNCNLLKAAPLTLMDGLVLGDLLPSVMSVAVTVALPAVLSVRLKLLVPPTMAVLTGKLALLSVELRPTV